MDWKREIRETFAKDGRAPEQDIIEELAMHAASAYEAARAAGRSHEEADQSVRFLLESWRSTAALLRRPGRPPMASPPPAQARWVTSVVQDIRYGLRLLRRQPAYALLGILLTALGISASTALFSITNGVLMRPLPWPDHKQLVRLTENRQGGTRRISLMTNATFLPWRESLSTLESITAWIRSSVTLTGSGGAERIRIAEVTSSLFQMLRARPVIGVSFDARDEGPGRNSVIVLSYGIWQQRFAGSRDAIGQTIELDRKPYVIVGVMPRDFFFPDPETRAWIPYYVGSVRTGQSNMTSLSMFNAMARLRPGVTAAEAAAEGTAIGRNQPDPGLVATAVFGGNGPVEVSAVPVLDAITGSVSRALVVLLAAGILLLVTAVANVANLQLVRATTRVRELAIRSAIGAGGARIAQQLLIESLLIAAAGGLLGLILAAGVRFTLPALLPADFPRVADVVVDSRVVAFAVTLAGLAGMAFGVLPALYVRRLNLAEAFAQDGVMSVGGRRSSRTRIFTMTGQVAIACLLLVGATLLLRAFIALTVADRGYDASNLLTARVPMPDFAFTPQRRVAFLDQTVERISAVPGVIHAAFTDGLPLTSGETTLGFTMPSHRPPVGAQISVHALQRIVSEKYFPAMAIRLVAGRSFTNVDTKTSMRVAVVNRSFASRYLGENPVGERLPGFFDNPCCNVDKTSPEVEVIGIIEDIHQQDVTDTVQPEVYVSSRQIDASRLRTSQPSLVVRTSGDPQRFIPILNSIVREGDASLALDSVMTMADRVSASLARPRLYALLLGAFAGFALAITTVGLFGVLSYSVAQRSREIAVRTAIGAGPRHVVRLVLRQALIVTAAGMLLGVGMSAGLVRYLSTFLYGINPYDYFAFIVAPLVILALAAVACLIPVRRALHIDPMRTMRAG